MTDTNTTGTSTTGAGPTEFVTAYLADAGDHPVDLDRMVTEPSGLDPEGMLAAIGDERFRSPGMAPLGLQLMCDLMAPEGSLYFDAIYGGFHGQHAIRNWLIPVMATIDFIEFAPTAAPVLFDDGEGATSLDEWQMIARFGDDAIPLSRGVSVRRYRDGWITWACDVYDTGPFRVPPPDDAPIELPEGAEEPEPLPDWPRTSWTADQTRPEIVVGAIDVDELVGGFADDAVLHDAIVGEVRGRDAIRAWFAESLGGVGDAVFEPLGPRLDDGTTSVQEWQLMAVGPDGGRTFVTRGTSVRRRTGGLVVEAADYYDTTSLVDPDVAGAMRAAGATLPGDELVARHRPG